MARYSRGILGDFSGTVGTVVGSVWRGIPYMRSKSRPSTVAPTDKQLVQRARFKLVATLIYSMSELLNRTFSAFATNRTGTNYALSLAIKQVSGTYPNLVINYNQVLISKGTLTNVQSPTASAAGSNNISFSWTDNSGSGNASATDKAIIVAYCEELGMTDYSEGAVDRSSASASINVARFTGKQVHTWLSFVSADGSEVATSIYTGQVTVA